MTTDELTCKEFVELVTDYFEGKLSREERDRFDGHLKTCDGCQIYLEQMRQTVQALGELPEESIPADAKKELLDAFRNWKSAS